MLEDLGFERLEGDNTEHIHFSSAEIAFRHPKLDPFNLILVDYNNGCWHFAQRKHAYNGIGKMVWLDDLIKGWDFVVGSPLLQ